jgi:hypothetical protein
MILRNALVGGPAKIAIGTSPFWTDEGGATFLAEDTSNDVSPAMFGKVDESVFDARAKVSFTPFGLWQSLPAILPEFYLAPVVGARLYGNTDQVVKVWGSNGDLYTITNGQVTKLPPLYFGADKPVFGACEITGLCGNGKQIDDVDSIYSYAAGGAEPTGQFSMDNYKQARYTGAWATVDGFAEVEGQDGITVDFEPKLNPITLQGRIVDYMLDGISVMAKLKPVGPTVAQIEAASKFQGTGFGAGRRRASGTQKDFVITGAGITFTIHNCVMKSHGYVFNGKALRNGEIAFVSTLKFTAGVPNTRVVTIA